MLKTILLFYQSNICSFFSSKRWCWKIIVIKNTQEFIYNIAYNMAEAYYNPLNSKFHHSSRILDVTLGVYVGVKKIRDIGLKESYSRAA